MNQTGSLLLALRAFRPRENNDPLENFVTAAFTWLLRTHPDFGAFYLKLLAEKLSMPPISASTHLDWDNHASIGGVIPDLICKAGDQAFIFEHKVGAPLAHNQLQNYRDAAKAKFRGGYKLILITRSVAQHPREADLELCWHEVHTWIKQWLAQAPETASFVFSDFCTLLEDEDMGPAPALTPAAILSFFPARHFEHHVSSLVHRASKHAWGKLLPPGAYEPFIRDQRNRLWGEEDTEGRIGFGLTGRNWSPGLFVGFLMDPADSNIELACSAVPDFSIIIDVNVNQYPRYDELSFYAQMVLELETAIVSHCPEFQFVNHRALAKDPNRWHPIHIRMSMLELLHRTRTADEQLTRFVEKASVVIKLINECSSFWQWRDELRAQPALPSSGA